MRVGPFAFRYQGNGAAAANILIRLERQLIALQHCRWEFLYNEILQQTFRPLLSKLPKRRQIYVLYPHFEEVRGGIEPWLMARWKAGDEFLLSVIELLFLSLTVEALQGKTCQNSLLSGGGRSLGAKISGGRGRPWGIFFGLYKTRHILLSTVQTAPCYVPSFWHNTGVWQTDRRTDRRNCYILVQRLQCELCGAL